MHIYILRHGPAVPREESVAILDDRDRELTPDGKKKTRLAARGLRALGLEVGLILTSPYARARQTADIVASELRIAAADVRDTSLLEPGAPPADLVKELAGLSEDISAVVLVGHEPDLSSLASVLLTGDPGAVRIEMKKAAVCAIECATLLTGERGTLRFLLQPAHLRALAG